jgi:hypothetical protein
LAAFAKEALRARTKATDKRGMNRVEIFMVI